MNFAQFSEFHFLRPYWLLMIPAAITLFLLIKRRGDPKARWRDVIADHLLDNLLVDRHSRWRIQSSHLVCTALAIGGVAAAGPAWEREPTPFTTDSAPLVVAMDLSPSMDAIDIQPTRLERAKQKVRDLLQLRQGARMALIAYAGEAYRILPLTDDPSIIELFVSSLSTGLMPAEGRDAVAALNLAEETLAKETAPGSILFISSGIERKEFPAFRKHADTSRNQVLMLAVGTAQGGPIAAGAGHFRSTVSGGRAVARMDVDALKAFASECDALVTSVTLNNDDLEWLQHRIHSHLIAARDKDPHARWKDMGYFLVFPVALLSALWFRKGWTVRYASVALIFVLMPDARAADFHFIDLWMTKDQQGRYYFENGDYATAAERFEDPTWRGLALYQAGKYDDAINSFAMVETAESYFHVGNCQARLGRYKEAVASYDQALKLRSAFPEATANRELVLKLIPKPKKDDDEEGEPDPNLKPDEVKFDEKGKKGKQGVVQRPRLSPEALADLWMRRIQVTPADFLRQKFLIERERTKAGTKTGQGGTR